MKIQVKSAMDFNELDIKDRGFLTSHLGTLHYKYKENCNYTSFDIDIPKEAIIALISDAIDRDIAMIEIRNQDFTITI